ncbi:MAG: thiol protease/hemagglutinin PrtT [Bacteroidales bacterium]|nr:thiol protease/hemagglutinin PrtT [Bacteroidales bacterium]
MKIRLLSISILFLGLLCGNAKADNVDLQTAKEVAAYYFTVATGAKAPVSADNLKLAKQFDNPTLCIPAMYAFNVAGNGFVVVSASDAVEPVLAYSAEGSLDPENINPACQYVLDDYTKLISQQQNINATPSIDIRNRWTELKEQTFSPDLTQAGVLMQDKAVLVSTKWDQGENYYPSYNLFCPVVNGKYSYAGCVAVAMGQIIKFWNYPEKGKGSATTDWDNHQIKFLFTEDSNRFVYDSMPNSISYNSPWNNRRAVAKLLYACGVTVNMAWSPEGSGTQSRLVPNALINKFRYSPEASYTTRDQPGMTDSKWISTLRSEIVDHQRPVYYSGYDISGSNGRDAGHAWIIAGASAADDTKFYINWGWGGSSNGFFTLAPASSIQPAGGYVFGGGHGMVFQIYPLNMGINDNTTIHVAPAYPNPATDYIMIPADFVNPAAMGVYSADGKMVDRIVIPANTKEYRLDLQRYAPGTYIYRLNGQVFKFTVL